MEFKKIFFFEFLGNFPKTKRNLFGGFFERNFLEEIFLEDFFWEDYFEDFLGGILREKFFVYTGIDLFVKILSQWRRKEEGRARNLDP